MRFAAGLLLAALMVSPSVPAMAGEPAVRGDIAATQAAFGYRLMERLGGDGETPNVIVSPASLAATLAYLGLGADPKMRDALAATLGCAPDNATDALAAVRAEAKILAAIPPGFGPLNFANAIFVDPGVDFFPAALASLADAGMTAEVAEINQPQGLAAINAWVDRRTGGAIPTILDAPLTGAALVALNAFRFKDTWQHQFETDLTRPAPFHLADGRTVEAWMMQLPPTPLAVRQDETFVGAILPYETERFAMVVVTTRGDPAGIAGFASAAGWLTGAGFADVRVTLSLPKFDLKATAHLLAVLDGLGLAAGQSPTAFAGFSDTPIVISDVIQKTQIKVDEVGTDAAVATAVIGRAGARPDPEIVVMNVDRPFIFAIVETASGFILLSGYVGNPTLP